MQRARCDIVVGIGHQRSCCIVLDRDVGGARMMLLAVRRLRTMLTPPTSASGPCGRGGHHF
eukprot:3299826-Pyramimonas_sp.AAC.1